MPEMFNKTFISKISNFHLACDSDNNVHRQTCPSAFTGGKFSKLRPLSESDKSIVLKSPPKSCILDPIPTQFLFHHIYCLICGISTIVDESLVSGFMPCFKKYIVSYLIPKQNLNQNVLKNYRAASNIPFISKVIEKAVCSQANEYLSSFSLFEKHQSAYKKLHNTETVLVKITKDLYWLQMIKKSQVLFVWTFRPLLIPLITKF